MLKGACSYLTSQLVKESGLVEKRGLVTANKPWTNLALAVACAFGAASSNGATVEWGSRSSVTTPLHVDSEGAPVAVTINIELGVFEAGFDPGSELPSTWFDAWITLDTADYNTGANFFSASYEAVDAAVAGRQAYIWLFTDGGATAGSEWALITDRDGRGGADWVVPAVGAGDQTDLPLEWRVSEATEVLFGATGSMAGQGVVNAAPPAGFELQTFGFAPPIPEPSVVTFLAAAAGIGLRRRR